MKSLTSPRAGYTLPVFACAAAIAALQHLQNGLKAEGRRQKAEIKAEGRRQKAEGDLKTPQRPNAPTSQLSSQNPKSKIQNHSVPVDLIKPDQIVDIPIEHVAQLDENGAMAIARSDPGDNLDLTRHTPVWAWVQWGNDTQEAPILIEGGEGIGRYQTQQLNDTAPKDSASKAAIYRYATELLQTNLQKFLPDHHTIKVTIILPEGRALATRTSNAAFGVVEGLSLLGTSGISQPLSTLNQLEIFRSDLTLRIRQSPKAKRCLVYCIGENGLDLARRFGIAEVHIVKTANWLGPLLVEGANQGVGSILLLGYHGKLIKLAGGIFHTHHHLADARLDIFTAQCSILGLDTPHLQAIWNCQTTEAALQYLTNLDESTGSHWVETVYNAIAQRIDQQAKTYIYTHSERQVEVGTVLFGRDRYIICQSDTGKQLGKHLETNFCFKSF